MIFPFAESVLMQENNHHSASQQSMFFDHGNDDALSAGGSRWFSPTSPGGGRRSGDENAPVLLASPTNPEHKGMCISKDRRRSGGSVSGGLRGANVGASLNGQGIALPRSPSADDDGGEQHDEKQLFEAEEIRRNFPNLLQVKAVARPTEKAKTDFEKDFKPFGVAFGGKNGLRKIR